MGTAKNWINERQWTLMKEHNNSIVISPHHVSLVDSVQNQVLYPSLAYDTGCRDSWYFQVKSKPEASTIRTTRTTLFATTKKGWEPKKRCVCRCEAQLAFHVTARCLSCSGADISKKNCPVFAGENFDFYWERTVTSMLLIWNNLKLTDVFGYSFELSSDFFH